MFMEVLNVAGYEFAVKYDDKIYTFPYDGRVYYAPDGLGEIKGLHVVVPPEKNESNVVELTDTDIENAKDNKKPLKGIKIKKEKRTKLKKTNNAGRKKKDEKKTENKDE